jgi:murein L,D-transpeptidase YafK
MPFLTLPCLRSALLWLGCGIGFLALPMNLHAQKRIQEVRGRVQPRLESEFSDAGVGFGSPVFIRIFKEEAEFELWVKPDHQAAYKRFKTWPVAKYSGTLGPKLQEGDGQAPEGFYSVSKGQLNPNSNFHLSFNIGYPNAYDRQHQRTGSLIMVHGSNVSIGCFAMTDPVIEEIYLAVEAALVAGQQSVPVHVFPFRMTPERMAKASAETSPWLEFWRELQPGFAAFEVSHIPPKIEVKADGRQALVSH